jgi:SPP1 gp7 family putative phage head morphogenesis protein
MADVNTELMNSLLRHAHFVRAYENDILKNEILPILLRAKIDMVGKFNTMGRKKGMLNLSKLGHRQKQILKQKIEEISLIIETANAKIKGILDKDLVEFAKEVEGINLGFLKTAIPISVAFNRIPLERLKKIIDLPLGGMKYAARLERNYKEAVNVIKREIAAGIVGGESVNQVRSRLLGVGRTIGGQVGALITHRAEMIVRSEIMRVSNAVNDELFRANDDIVKGVMWLATLDSRTCPECSELDGKEYYYDRNEVPPERPLHCFCRCIVTSILKSWQELGAKGDMAKQLDKLDPGARASMTGYVPAKVHYPEWFNAQPDKFKQDVLGPKRFIQYKKKGLSYNQMVKNGRWVTLKDLNKYK